MNMTTLKPRNEPEELKLLRLLNSRMVLSEEDKHLLRNVQKGLDGEHHFDSKLEKLTCENIILNDLLFELNHTAFQIDSLLITSKILYLFEVKNYEGDFYLENNH